MGFGLVLMLVEIGLLIIIKFYRLPKSSDPTLAFVNKPRLNLAVWVACGSLLIPATILFIFFAMQYYKRLASGRIGNMEDEIGEEYDKLFDEHQVFENSDSENVDYPSFVQKVNEAAQNGNFLSKPATSFIVS